MDICLFMQQYRWFRYFSVFITETFGTYLGHSVGDWWAYHFRIPHSLMEVAEELRDWKSYRNCARWIRKYEEGRK